MKTLLFNNEDHYMALLNSRATSLPWYGHSPAELLMGRQIYTKLSQTKESLIPTCHYLDDFKRKSERKEQTETEF